MQLSKRGESLENNSKIDMVKKQRLESYKDTRYAQLLDECLAQVKEQMEEKNSKKNKKREVKIDHEKYKLKIIKPDLSYLLANSESIDKDEIAKISSLKIKDDEQLARVMAKHFYAKWYVKPSLYQHSLKQAHMQHKIEEVENDQDLDKSSGDAMQVRASSQLSMKNTSQFNLSGSVTRAVTSQRSRSNQVSPKQFVQ